MFAAGVSTLLATVSMFFFFNDTATTEIYTLSLHDALPISKAQDDEEFFASFKRIGPDLLQLEGVNKDRKSTRLNSSHSQISYAVFCLKKKKTTPAASRDQAF